MQQIEQLAKILLAKKNRRWIAVGVLIITVLLVAHFFFSNPQYIEQLAHVSPSVIVLVILLNIPATVALAWAYYAILQLCGKPIAMKENILLTAYSSIINFFGPLQSGPGVRAVYLKTRHKVRIRDYMLATLVYYAFYATFCALFLLVGTRPWWQTALGLLVVAGFSTCVIGWFIRRDSKWGEKGAPSAFAFRRSTLIALAIAVLLQITCNASYFYVELHAVNPSISISQAISYTGAAGFSLFVSLTPDAVGFREAFLIFSQQLHHISTADILNANIIDRGSYVLYLVLLLLFTLSVHARDRLQLRNWRHPGTTKESV
jgi:uncharacterized membrane protein YbhN (UPF0104 family)